MHYDQNDDDSLTEADIVAWSLDPVDLDDDTEADEDDLAILMDVISSYGS